MFYTSNLWECKALQVDEEDEEEEDEEEEKAPADEDLLNTTDSMKWRYFGAWGCSQ